MRVACTHTTSTADPERSMTNAPLTRRQRDILDFYEQ
ncbi:MAG: hypothetical protein RL112_1276, partial [Planctomycetota bacterium]